MWWYLLAGLAGLAVGVIGGFYLARRQMEKYLKDNPPVNEQMLNVMMTQMGMKPSQKKLNQMMKAMNNAKK